MKKKFYKYSAYAVIGTALLSVLFSLFYFIAAESIDAGSSFLIFLYYMKVLFDMTATFVGYTTIIYAVTKFGWFDGVVSVGLYFCSVVLFALYQTVTSTIYASNSSLDATVGTDERLIDLIIFNAYYSFGQLFITLVLPAALIAFMSYKMIKKNDTPFEKAVSFSNPVQKTAILFGIILFAVNFVGFLSIDILPFLIEEGFYITYSDFKTIIIQSFISLAEMSVSYIVLQYIVFMLGFKYYDYCLNIKHDAVADKNKKNK